MNRWLLLFVISAVSYGACKKDGMNNNNSAYYIKATLNGKEKTFLGSPSAFEYSGDITAGFSMSAKNDSAKLYLSLNINHPFGIKITKGIYDKPANGYFSTVNYTIDTVYYVSRLQPDSSTIQITISNITNSTVTGTFSGSILNTADSTDAVTIKNGSFYLPIK